MPETLVQALLEVQKKATTLQKDAINPHFGSSYVSLESLMGQVLPLLTEQEVLLMQSPTLVDGIRGLTTTLTHVPSGEFIVDTMALTGKEDPQGQGSAITYARRYMLMSMLSLVADEDDDGTEGTPSRASKSTVTKSGRKTASSESSETTPKF